MSLARKKHKHSQQEEEMTFTTDLNPKLPEEKSNEVKLRLILSTTRQHPLCQFLEEVKLRGIKNFDPHQFVLSALNQIDPQWWKDQLEALTPLEFKITAALADPDMREKLKMLLASQQA